MLNSSIISLIVHGTIWDGNIRDLHCIGEYYEMENIHGKKPQLLAGPPMDTVVISSSLLVDGWNRRMNHDLLSMSLSNNQAN